MFIYAWETEANENELKILLNFVLRPRRPRAWETLRPRMGPKYKLKKVKEDIYGYEFLILHTNTKKKNKYQISSWAGTMGLNYSKTYLQIIVDFYVSYI